VLDVAAEVDRLTALGATVIDPAHDDDGFLTVVLADPQGNEFCVLRPPDGDERPAEI
jgi:predicted enzyme related to lactoylglutathione lyase